MNKICRIIFTLALLVTSGQQTLLHAQVVESGKKVALFYSVKHMDGTLIASNFQSTPLIYIYGTRQLVPGLEKALAGMQIGQSKELTVPPAEAYGAADPSKIVEVQRNTISGNVSLGQFVEGVQFAGQLVRAKVIEVRPNTLMLDFNHPLAGQTLQYSMQVVSIEDLAAS